MFNKLNIRFDQISFILGVIAGSFLWWLLSRLRTLFPKVKLFFSKKIEGFRGKYFAGMDAIIREEMYKYVQTIHLAKSLFPFSEIIIPPRLIANSFLSEKPECPVPDSIAKQIIPYTPDFPELASIYPYPSISLAEAIQNNANIAVIGAPGTGKTTALAHLTTLISKNDPAISKIGDLIPLYIHILEIQINEEEAPFENVIQSLCAAIPSFSETSLRRFLMGAVPNGNILLLIDGLDELFPAVLKKKVEFLQRLMKAFPNFHYIVTAHPENLDNLVPLGFIPMPVALWNFNERSNFLRKWEKIWKSKTSNLLKKDQKILLPDASIIINWLENENGLYTPLEWTLIAWTALAGALKEISQSAMLEGFINLVRENTTPRNALYAFAADVVSQEKSWFEYDQIEKSFARFRPKEAKVPDGQKPEPWSSSKANGNRSKDKRITSRERAIETLFENGLLNEHRNGLMTFQNPVFAAYLASFSSTMDILSGANIPQSSIIRSTLPFMAANDRADDMLDKLLAKHDSSPFLSSLMLAAQCASQTNKKCNWRTKTFYELSNSLIDETLPISVRLRALTALLKTNDPSIIILFKQLITHPSPSTRKLVALACGAMRENSLSNELAGLLKDENNEVRNAACMALSVSNTYASNRKIQEILISGDEGQKQAAAESFIGKPNGNELILKLLDSEDLLTRRAAIIALSNIREQWAEKTIEKVAVEDKQWIVRNVSSQILESFHHPNPDTPIPLAKADESPWLLKFAAKKGMGLKPGEGAGDILLSALIEGNCEEALSSLQYLIKIPDEDVIKGIVQLLNTKNESLYEACILALWYISVGNTSLLRF
jgi:HEAT repeat protein